MENPININREMANALRALAVADHGPMADRVDVVTALAKLGIKCQPLGGALFIGNRDTLALADYIDRPSGNADDAERSRLDMAMSLREAVSESVAAEKELLRDGDICGRRGLLDLCDFAEALGVDVKYYNEEYPAVAQSEARGLADKIDVQTCIYVRGKDNESHNFAGPVWFCNKCGHDEGEYGAYFYRHCPVCGRKIEKTVG